MPHLQLTFPVPATLLPRYEHALESAGALATTLQDAYLDAADEQAIFEPGVGETPLWGEMMLTALFAADTDALHLLAELASMEPELDWSSAQFETVADQDWERAWMDQFQPMRFGRRLWVYPWNIDPPVDADSMGRASASCACGTSASMRAVVRLDPGLAFGTGTHPTTALCLEWLDSLNLAGKTLIDYGCGSGVLAIAALKLGAVQAVGVDNDQQALTASRDNAERNGVGQRLHTCFPADTPDQPVDVLIANILAGPLAELAPRFATLLHAGAPFALSGILDGQQDELLARYAPWFNQLEVTMREDWIRISGRRNTHAAVETQA